MLKSWGKRQLPLVLFILGLRIMVDIVAPLLSWPEISLPKLPPSPLSLEDVIPPIFAGSITAISILIGFFSVSIFQFRRSCAENIDSIQNDKIKAVVNFKRHIEELEDTLEKLKKSEGARKPDKEIQKIISAAEAKLEKAKNRLKEVDELYELNWSAIAHQQEHCGDFMLVYLLISYLILLSSVTSFFSTIVTEGLISIFIDLNIIFLSTVFTGLMVFLAESITYRVHQEMI